MNIRVYDFFVYTSVFSFIIISLCLRRDLISFVKLSSRYRRTISSIRCSHTFLSKEILLVSFYLDFNKFQDVFYIIEICSLVHEFILYILDSFSVLIIEVLECVNDIEILIGDQRFLENSEVKQIDLGKTIFHDFIWKCFKHEHNI